MKMRINKIYHNWSAATSDGFGEEYCSLEVGKIDTISKLEVCIISECKPETEGDKLHYDVVFKDGSMVQVFNPNQVFWSNPPSLK